MRRRTSSIVGLSAAIAVVLTGCSSKAEEDSGGGGDSGGVKTDIGVTDTEIHLGVLTDMSGPFKEGGLGQTHGNEIWADEINAAGGICDRDIVLDIQDMGYKADNAVPLYATMSQNNVGMLQLLGSPILAALKQQITTDKMLSVPGSWASSNLDSPSVMMVGQTYDVEMINALAWAQEQGMIAEGDKLGHIYVDSEYGQNGLLGSKSYAKDHDMEIVPVAVSGTDTDMTATMTKLKSDGVTAVLMTIAPAATASVAIQNVNQGLNVPLLGNNPTWAPALLENPSVVSALSNFYVSVSVNTFSSQDPKVQEVLKAYNAKGYTEPPFDAVLLGYSYGMAWKAVLEQACEDGDLTRDGIMTAKSKVDNVDTEKIIAGPLDFSVEGAPSTRVANIAQADPDAISGVKIVEQGFESKDAKEYKAPFQK